VRGINVRNYSKNFFKEQSGGSFSSAEVVVPFVINLLNPKSVVDVGCGVGTWLSVFKKMGVDEILGLDGKWVDQEMLRIPSLNFCACDLAVPQYFNRTFDLAMSVEVAEHLPESAASILVKTLTSLSNVVLFAAAVPGQAGLNHINCQWPEYWAKLFEENGYIPVDVIRSKIWNEDGVEYWYCQNIILYIDAEHIHTLPELKKEYELRKSDQLSIVHPSCFLRYADPSRMSLRRTLTALPEIAFCSFKRVFKRRFLEKTD